MLHNCQFGEVIQQQDWAMSTYGPLRGVARDLHGEKLWLCSERHAFGLHTEKEDRNFSASIGQHASSFFRNFSDERWFSQRPLSNAWYSGCCEFSFLADSDIFRLTRPSCPSRKSTN